MRVVLTNDDGFDSPGIEALRAALESRHEVWIVAPDRNRSGVSCALSLDAPIRVERTAERVYRCSGTPVDCVNVAHSGLVVPRPDAFLSGINLGANLGSDLSYSGTAGAARQAAWKGYPSVATSLFADRAPYRFGPAAAFVADRLEELVGTWDGGFYYNLNFPNADAFRSVEECLPARLSYAGGLVALSDGGGGASFAYRSSIADEEPEPGSDWAAVRSGSVSLTLISLMPPVFDGSVRPAAILA